MAKQNKKQKRKNKVSAKRKAGLQRRKQFQQMTAEQKYNKALAQNLIEKIPDEKARHEYLVSLIKEFDDKLADYDKLSDEEKIEWIKREAEKE